MHTVVRLFSFGPALLNLEFQFLILGIKLDRDYQKTKTDERFLEASTAEDHKVLTYLERTLLWSRAAENGTPLPKCLSSSIRLRVNECWPTPGAQV